MYASLHHPAMGPDPRSELLKLLFTSDSEDCDESCAATPPMQAMAAKTERSTGVKRKPHQPVVEVKLEAGAVVPSDFSQMYTGRPSKRLKDSALKKDPWQPIKYMAGYSGDESSVDSSSTSDLDFLDDPWVSSEDDTEPMDDQLPLPIASLYQAVPLHQCKYEHETSDSSDESECGAPTDTGYFCEHSTRCCLVSHQKWRAEVGKVSSVASLLPCPSHPHKLLTSCMQCSEVRSTVRAKLEGSRSRPVHLPFPTAVGVQAMMGMDA